MDDLTTQLQLDSEQVALLQGFLAGFSSARSEGLRTKREKLQREGPGSGIDPVALRGELEEMRRSVLEKFLPALSTEQQGRVRQMLATTRPPRSPVPPLKPRLPSGLLSNGEALIPLVRPTENTSTRSRRASQMPLSADQKILHFLNRAGYGPRPGDVERVGKMGLDRYLEQQLHPENLRG